MKGFVISQIFGWFWKDTAFWGQCQWKIVSRIQKCPTELSCLILGVVDMVSTASGIVVDRFVAFRSMYTRRIGGPVETCKISSRLRLVL